MYRKRIRRFLSKKEQQHDQPIHTTPRRTSASASGRATGAHFTSSAGRPAANSATTFATTWRARRGTGFQGNLGFGPAGFGPGRGFEFGFDPRGGFGLGPGPGGAARPRPRRRGRGRRGDVRAAILKLLAERPMHGYEMIQEIAERSQNLWRPSPGSVYPTLQLLVDEGLIVATEVKAARSFSS